jgi:hypothetical protein
MLTKRFANGLLLSGLISIGSIYAAPAVAQSALAQQSTSQPSTKSSTVKPNAKAATAPAKKVPPKPLVYVVDNRSSNKAADASTSKPVDSSIKTTNASVKNASATSASKSPDASANQKPLSADLAKAFEQNCPSAALTENKPKAAYDVTFEREPGSKGVKTAFGLTNAVHKMNRIEVMGRTGKELFSESAHSINQLVKDACTAIGTPNTKIAKN